jgi:hypothetical protein
MQAAIDNPIYTVTVKAGDKDYDISGAIESLDFSDQQKQFAQSVTINLFNKKVEEEWLNTIFQVRQEVVINANDGKTKEEVFQGFIWTKSYKSHNKGKVLSLKCYDNLIYMQESEDYEFFASGKSTKDAVTTLCSKWGVKLDYSYDSITHTKMVLRGNLADIFTADILDLVKDQTGKKYVIRSEKGVMKIMHVGQNSTVYNLKRQENVVSTASECTMEGMVTKVVILGKEDENDRSSIEDTVSGQTKEYGTLQKVINKDSNTTLAEARKEAQSILKESGQPKWTYEVEAVDIPWIRKGDKVFVNAGDMANFNGIVIGADRSISSDSKLMTLTIESV